jgi:hypothetical protein
MGVMVWERFNGKLLPIIRFTVDGVTVDGVTIDGVTVDGVTVDGVTVDGFP